MELPLTPLDFLTRARRLFPERDGIVQWDGDERRVWSYAEFGRRCDRQAHALTALGVRPGDRVAWLCGNTHELLEAYYATLLAGAVLLPLNIRLSPAELRFVLDDAGARVLIRHPALGDPESPTIEHHVVLGEEFESLLAAQPDTPFGRPDVVESTAAELFYTSGSTGQPKGALLTHRGLYLHAVHSALTNGVSGHDVIAHLIPLFHVNGWGTPHFLTALGGVHVMLARFDAGEVLRLIEVERVTRVFGVPAMMTALLAHPSVSRRDLSSVRQVSIGGAPAAPSLLAEVEARFGCDAICGYGLTETSPTLTRSIDKPGTPRSVTRRATTGLPILGVDVRVLDEAGAEVAWDGRTPGEVCVRSNHVMAGYWRRPEETAVALGGGWFHTEDIAVVDAEGYLTIVDRKKDLIISGGENISSVEVEKALADHPAVLECAVVGVASDRWGEVPEAWVVLRVPPSTVTGEELIAHVRQRLAAFKAPARVHLVDALPKGGTGKIQKTVLREWSSSIRRPAPEGSAGT